MQKKLIALAIAAALAPAAAMAETSNVTVYGVADASFDSTKNGGTNGVTVSKVSSNASRLGLKGSEDLGGGLKAIFQIEQQIYLDGTGAAAANELGNRNTFVGLAGDSWGSLTLGRNDTPYKTSTRALDVFMDHIADNRTLMGRGINATMTASAGSFDARLTDTIRYDSPNFSGFKVAGSYSFGSEATTSSTNDIKAKIVSLSGNYATGPFNAALAYQKNTFGSNNALGGPAITAATNCGTTLCDEKAWKIGGGYSVSQFTVNAVYEKTSDNQGVNGIGHKAYYLAGAFNATANDAIKLAYTRAKNTGDGSDADSGAKQWALGVDHNMSKRTTVYAQYTKLDNDGNTTTGGATYALSNAAGVATGATAANGQGADPSAFSFGIKHVF